MKVKFIGILLASFIGAVFNPEFLAASDSVVISDLDQSNIAETIKEEKSVILRPISVGLAVPTVTPTVPKAGMASNRVEFAWGAQDLVFSDSAALDAGRNTVKVGRMIYGHEYTDFGKILNLNIGDTFSVVINGTVKGYRVVANPIDGTRGVAVKVINAKRGEIYHEKLGNFYASALERGWRHDLVLLTCSGADRYIVVADEI